MSFLAALAPWTNPTPNLTTAGILAPPMYPTLPVFDCKAAAYPAKYPASCSENVTEATFLFWTTPSIKMNFLSANESATFGNSFSK